MIRQLFFLGLIALGLQKVSAQSKTDSIPRAETLEEIRISSFHIKDSLMDAPAAIGILSEKELQGNNNADITPAMNAIPGVFMQSGSYNTNRISIRGIGARTPYGTNKIRAFYGNIPLTSGDSETTVEDIDLENIRQVEIIKGPLSSIYGAGLGGAILITPKLSGAPQGKATFSATHGSYGLLKNSIGYSLDGKRTSLNISYHKLATGGWRENSAYNREGVTLAGELFPSKKSKWTYFGNYTFLKAYIASSIDKETFENNPRAAAFTWKSAKGYEQYDSYLGGLSYETELSANLRNATSVFVNHKESDEPRPFDILRQNTTGYGARTQFSGDFGARKKASFLAGAEYFRDNFKGRTFENLYQNNNGAGSLEGSQLTQAYQNRTFYNVFLQLRLVLPAHFEIQAGANFNKTMFTLENTLPSETASDQKYGYDGVFSPQVSVLYKPAGPILIYASASRGFSMPAIEETLGENGTINPRIKPENGYNLEIGGKFYLLKRELFAEISAYRMEIRDLLVAERIGEDQYVGANAGKTLHQGVEISAHWQLKAGPFFTVDPYFGISFGEYTFRKFNNNGTDFSGNALPGVPKKKASAGVSIQTRPGIYLCGDLLFTDKMPLNDGNSAYSDAYRIWNLKAGWKFRISKALSGQVAAGVNNVSDEHYAAMVLVNATGFGNAAPRFYYPGLPLNYYGNAGFSYWF